MAATKTLTPTQDALVRLAFAGGYRELDAVILASRTYEYGGRVHQCNGLALSEYLEAAAELSDEAWVELEAIS